MAVQVPSLQSCSVSFSPVQTGSPQVVVVAGYVQARWPSQLPLHLPSASAGPPQSLSGSVPLALGVQRPSLPATSQRSQPPLQAVSQHLPSTH